MTAATRDQRIRVLEQLIEISEACICDRCSVVVDEARAKITWLRSQGPKAAAK